MEFPYRNVFDKVQDGIYFCDLDRKITYWNNAAEKITGFSASEVLGSCCSDKLLMHIDEEGCLLCEDKCPVSHAMEDGQEREELIYLHHKDGHRVPVTVRITPIRDARGNVTGAVEIFSDNSPSETSTARIEELEKLVFLDPLTNLPNRRYIDVTLQSRLNELMRYGWTFGIIFADIDDFKKINDTYGHAAGDKVLKMVSKTLMANSRPFDVCGRFGGEEFVGIIGHVDHEGLYTIGDRLRILVESSYVTIGGQAVGVTISVGGTLAGPDEDAVQLLKRADELMYESKKAGKNRIYVK